MRHETRHPVPWRLLLQRLRRTRNETKDDTGAAKRACSVEECFFERDIRDFEVIDQTHLIVYTGSQRCAFHIELRGTLCDLTFAPELYFRRRTRFRRCHRSTVAADSGTGTGPGGSVRSARDERASDRDLRICTTISRSRCTAVDSRNRQSTDVPTDRFGNPRTDCRVSTVTSITDDQLVEFYVGRGVVPPLPPMGTGEIEVGEQEERRSAGASRTPTRSRRTRAPNRRQRNALPQRADRAGRAIARLARRVVLDRAPASAT